MFLQERGCDVATTSHATRTFEYLLLHDTVREGSAVCDAAAAADAMDVLAGLLAAKAEQEDMLDEARGGKSDGSFVARHLRRAGLSKAQALSSLASLADWVTDFYYYYQAESWTEGRYPPSSDEIVGCAARRCRWPCS